jgi:purine/pyrimidine-nucleoside phosphorylase
MDGAVYIEPTRLAMNSLPTEFTGVTALTKANVYYEGKVLSHALIFPDGSRKTLGAIYPGTFHFGTGQPEQMQIVEGTCRVKLDGETESRMYAPGDSFIVAGESGFEIAVQEGICQYICSFLT